jgi:hypothetical protein
LTKYLFIYTLGLQDIHTMDFEAHDHYIFVSRRYRREAPIAAASSISYRFTFFRPVPDFSPPAGKPGMAFRPTENFRKVNPIDQSCSLHADISMNAQTRQNL